MFEVSNLNNKTSRHAWSSSLEATHQSKSSNKRVPVSQLRGETPSPWDYWVEGDYGVVSHFPLLHHWLWALMGHCYIQAPTRWHCFWYPF